MGVGKLRADFGRESRVRGAMAAVRFDWLVDRLLTNAIRDAPVNRARPRLTIQLTDALLWNILLNGELHRVQSLRDSRMQM